MIKKLTIFTAITTTSYYAFTTKQQKKDFEGILKSMRNSLRAGVILAKSIYEYKYELGQFTYNTDQYHQKRSQIHYRVARRILDLSELNKGIYLKLGQYLGNLERVVPREFTEILKVLQDSAPSLPFEEIKIVIQQDLQRPVDQIFQSIDQTAIAAASLAQVHRAKLKSGEVVAVKIQFPFLRKETKFDLLILQKITQICNKLLQMSKSDEFDLVKLFKTFTSTIVEELDFENQVKNAEKTKILFKEDARVHIPQYYAEISSKRLIVMEFMEGVKINDKQAITNLGLDPKIVANYLVQIFAKMIFIEGHIHCDAHPGNILVRKIKDQPQIVLLDHGLYRNIEKQFLLNFSRLWVSLVSFDGPGIRQSAEKLKIHEHIQFLPLIFLHRTIESTKKLGAPITPQERKYLRSMDIANFDSINKLLQDLPPDLMFIIRASNLVSMHNSTLGGDSRSRIFFYTNLAMNNCYPSLFARCWAKFHLLLKIFIFEHANWLFRRLYSSILKID